MNIHPRSAHYTGPPEPVFQNCLAPQVVLPQQAVIPQQVAVPPIIRTRTSSGYSTYSNILITPDEVSRSNHGFHEGTLFCAIVSKAQIRFENAHPEDIFKDKKKLVWNKYNAVIACNGKLELYKSCQCKDWVQHTIKRLVHIKDDVTNTFINIAFVFNTIL